MIVRAPRAIGRMLRGALVWSALALLGAWALGRLAGDRWLWSQYLSWMPTLLVAPLSLALLGAWRLLRPRKHPRHARRITPARIALALSAVAFAHLALVELNAPALLRPPREGDFRVLFWNAANRPLEFPPTLVRGQRPDLAIITNPRWRMGREMLFTLVADAQAGPKSGHVVWRHGFAIASRYPILDHGSASLGLRGVRDGMDPQREGEAAYDAGSAAFVVLDAREALGRTITVWALDMPSDPRVSRMTNARSARAAIGAWRSPEGAHGFPEPDLIVGDLNTPRGAASLGTLAPSMRDASQASAGVRGTWPRGGRCTMPSLWQIDHVLHSTRWRAVRWKTVDPGVGTHCLVVSDLARRP